MQRTIVAVACNFSSKAYDVHHSDVVYHLTPRSLASQVAFIDTENTFRPERIVPIAQRFGLDSDAVLNNIAVARAYTHESQIGALLGV